ncbi:uncharacterized protein [Dysidea avara]|uniref:uncharacterized protein isoform X2 n=1 Tax=Dysidea avara TaxID=196820 RepID=UPI00333265C8
MLSKLILLFLIGIGTVLEFGETQRGCCNYPTYYDSESDACTLTCPSGSYGVGNDTDGDCTRNCTPIPSDFIGLFNATQYAFDFSIYASYGTVVFVAQYSVNPSVTLEYLSFDIMLTSMMIGEADIIGEAGVPFLINGTDTTINVRSLNQSEYLLPITIEFLLQDSVYDVNTNITFELLSNISTVDGMTASPFASAILFITDPCDECVSNSSCDPQSDGSVTCVCPIGYNGSDCDNYIGYCMPNPCDNGGTCTDISDNFTCTCPTPLSGRICEVDLEDNCQPVNPCANNGTCVDMINDIMCTCTAGFTANDCSVNIDDCVNITCSGNGACMDLINDFQCNCSSGFTGELCDTVFNPCDNVDCSNGGTCNVVDNTFSCTCVDGYTGSTCETVVNKCDPNPCANNGTCEGLVNNYTCHCVLGYGGKNCNTQGCFTYPTYYDNETGMCVETCPARFYGAVSGTSNNLTTDRARNCLPIPAGFFAFFNATQYEFDVNVRSTVGSVVFNVLVITENVDDIFTIDVFFGGSASQFSLTRSNITLVTVTLNTTLDPNDEEVVYRFTLTAIVASTSSGATYSQEVKVLLYEIDPCNDCVLNSTCTPQSDGSVTCVCPDGYTGANCDISTSCFPNPCMNGGNCSDEADGFTCSCPFPLNGTLCDVDTINDCPPNFCGNGTCNDFINYFNCTCLDGFTGFNCSTIITDECDCDNEGMCTNGSCVCPYPWTGITCDTDGVDNCSDVNCNNGTCVDLVDGFLCQCHADFTGRFCDELIDTCTNITCLNNGTCVNHINNNFTCQCAPGYEGRYCAFSTACDPNPCENQGECMSQNLNYTCICRQDFTGMNCEQRINDCVPINPCQNNGICTDGFASYFCTCPEGITGDSCEFNPCDPDPCGNNGDCNVLSAGNYSCDCTRGYTGNNCTTEINECELYDPCRNNATCRDLFDDYTCSCTQEYTGKNCTVINYCYPQPCENNGNCSVIPDNYMCDCANGYGGKNCSENYCEPNPCLNNGTCTGIPNDFMCNCIPGYTNKTCDMDINECFPMPCINGFCTNLVNDYLCECTNGYTGKNCSENYCEPNPCLHNGTCNLVANSYTCNCTSVYIGRNCSIEGKGCPNDIDDWKITWQATHTGGTTNQSCPNSQDNSTAFRVCNNDMEWEVPDLSNCQSVEFVDLQGRVQALQESSYDITTLIAHASELSMITETAESGPILPRDVIAASDILTTIIKSTENLDDASITEIGMLASQASIVLDNLLSSANDISFQQPVVQDSNASKDLLRSIENVGQLLAGSINTTSSQDVTIERNNIIISASVPTKEFLSEFNEIKFPNQSKPVINDLENQAQMIIPSVIISKQEGTPLINSISRSISSRLPNNMKSKMPVGVTISSQISLNGSSVKLPDNTEVTLYIKISNLPRNSSALCVFWDFENGGWSTKGVTTKGYNRNRSVVHCTSSHLTSFAILVGASGTDEEALSFISYIGCGISIACLTLTIAALVLLRKKIFNKIQHFIHLNLSIALLLGLITFVAGIEAANDSDVGCTLVAVILHYTFLAVFCWMLCEGIVIYILLYFVFYKGFFKTWKFYMILGWGLPIPVVAISAGAAHKQYGTDETCWLSEEKGTIWAFIVPMLLIILVNIFFLFAALRQIYKSKAKDLKKSNAVTAKSLIKATIVLLPLFGTTWIVGLFAVNKHTTVFAYIFTFLNVFQGVFIFLFYIMRNEKFLQFLKGCKLGEKYSITHSDSNTAGSGSTNPRNRSSISEAPKRLARKISKTWEEYNDSVRKTYTTVSEEDEESMAPPASTNSQVIEFEFGPGSSKESDKDDDGSNKEDDKDDDGSNKEDDKDDDGSNQEAMNSDTEKIHTEETEM